MNWIASNLKNALDIWNSFLETVWRILFMSPQDFNGGTVYNAIVDVHDAVKAIALGLLVLFFLMGVVKTAGSFTEIKKPEHALKLFIRFAIAKGVITYGLELLLALYTIGQGVMQKVFDATGASLTGAILPQEVIDACSNAGFWASIGLWAVTLIGSLVVLVLGFVVIMSVYGRFFRLFLYIGIAPIPLSTFAGEPTQNIGKSFIKSFAAVCLEGAIIAIACVIYSLMASSVPPVDPTASASGVVWWYLVQMILNMLILVGIVKGANRVVREMMGL